MNTVAAVHRFRRLLSAGATLIMALSAPVTSHAAITADFSVAGDWPGSAGSGWAGPWQSGGSETGTGIVNTSPLHGGGSYLQFVDSAAVNPAYIRRQMDGSGGVNLLEPYTLTLSFRFDGDLSTFTTFNDRIALFGDPSAVSGSSASNTWLIGVAGGNTDAASGQSVFPGNWYFFDRGSTNSFNTSNMVDTEMALEVGRVYGITIDVNPLAGTYNASIDNGEEVFAATDLTFRRGTTGQPGNWININMNSGNPADSAAFSVDNIQIQQVPEPSVAVALLVGAGMLAVRRRRLDGPAF